MLSQKKKTIRLSKPHYELEQEPLKVLNCSKTLLISLNIDVGPISSFSFLFSSFSLVERPWSPAQKTAHEISVLLLHSTVFLCNELIKTKAIRVSLALIKFVSWRCYKDKLFCHLTCYFANNFCFPRIFKNWDSSVVHTTS